MDYFLLKQNEKYNNIPRLKNLFKKINVKNINRLKADEIDDVVIFDVDADDGCEYPDILDRQLYLISEKLISIICRYDLNIIVKTLPLIDMNRDRQENYYLPIFEEVEALSDKSEKNTNGNSYKKIVLDKKKVNGKKIFKIKDIDKTLVVVRLDVAESILRRKPKGISLERLECV